MQLRRIPLLWLLVAGPVVVPAPAVRAVCHSFTVQASPAQIGEGGTVTVTVNRDAGFAPSQVDVSTVDETARAGEDYTALQETVAFTTETERRFPIPITDDASAEGAETFRVHLSNPGGCPPNPNFVVGPDATVSISDNEAPPPG